MLVNSPQKIQTRFFDDIYKPTIEKLPTPLPNIDRGKKVLTEEVECDTYIALYGGHHFHKLYAAFPLTNFEYIEGKNIEIIDWGCGQALATCILLDYFIEKCITPKIESITLIEPSSIALWRGYGFVRQMLQTSFPNNFINWTVNKYIDDLNYNDFNTNNDNIKIHLFSNIIDVEKFDLDKLYRLMNNSFTGINRIICTSPSHNTYNYRIDKFHNLFCNNHRIKFSSHTNESISKDVFYFNTGRFETRIIKRYERQFTAIL
ncbi:MULTISPECIES: hypothetical protein [unclassified Nostoc]|uniref:hypothetical protein n=1 Tax=unclassified Nostoc TaxID=2593658 RepID=UPI00262AA95D|nr:hypothetical protein [Nostoc sp. S13]MDF5739217.1 hypothetical protein [Nostoc sp. S13]